MRFLSLVLILVGRGNCHERTQQGMKEEGGVDLAAFRLTLVTAVGWQVCGSGQAGRKTGLCSF